MFKTQTLLVQHFADVKHLQSADISVAMGQELAKASGRGNASAHWRTGELGPIAELAASFQLTDPSCKTSESNINPSWQVSILLSDVSRQL